MALATLELPSTVAQLLTVAQLNRSSTSPMRERVVLLSRQNHSLALRACIGYTITKLISVATVDGLTVASVKRLRSNPQNRSGRLVLGW